MNPRDILTSLRRGWYVLVVGVLTAAALTYLIVTQIGPTYQARASVVLVPGDAVIPEDSNPFLYLGGGTVLRDVLVRVLSSDAVSTTVLDGRSDDITYEVGPDPMTAGPILVASTRAPSEDEALQTLQDVLDRVPVALEDVQESREVGVDARFTSMVLAQEQRASANYSSMIRLLVAAVGVCGVLSIFAATWLDGRRRRAGPRHSGAVEEEQSATDPGAVGGTPTTLHPSADHPPPEEPGTRPALKSDSPV